MVIKELGIFLGVRVSWMLAWVVCMVGCYWLETNLYEVRVSGVVGPSLYGFWMFLRVSWREVI